MFVMFMLLFNNACMNLRIDVDVDYPAELFSATMKKIDRIHAADPLRKGTVSNLNVLVYVGDERKLVSFSLPKETVQKGLDGEFAGEVDMKEVTKKVGQVDWKKLKNLDRLGPGLILQAEVEEDDVHLLIWLD
jgi:hypothetical protein